MLFCARCNLHRPSALIRSISFSFVLLQARHFLLQDIFYDFCDTLILKKQIDFHLSLFQIIVTWRVSIVITKFIQVGLVEGFWAMLQRPQLGVSVHPKSIKCGRMTNIHVLLFANILVNRLINKTCLGSEWNKGVAYMYLPSVCPKV